MIYRFSVNSVDDNDPELGGESGNFDGFRSDIEREYPSVQQHDEESADLVTAAAIALEATYISGAEVEVYLRTDNPDFDHVWDEDPDPTYWPGVIRKAFFAPKAIEAALKMWGIDAVVKLEMFFSLADVKRYFGNRGLRVGDVIRVPYGAIGNITPKNFRVINASVDGNYKFSWLYFKCSTQSLTGDITVQPRPEDVAMPDQQGE